METITVAEDLQYWKVILIFIWVLTYHLISQLGQTSATKRLLLFPSQLCVFSFHR